MPAATPLRRASSSSSTKWLREVVVGAGIQGRATFSRSAPGGDRSKIGTSLQPPYAARRARRRHHPAARGRAPARREGASATSASASSSRPRRLNNVAGGPQHDPKADEKLRLVVHDESARGGRRSARAPSDQSHRMPGSSAAAAARSRLPRAPDSWAGKAGSFGSVRSPPSMAMPRAETGSGRGGGARALR